MMGRNSFILLFSVLIFGCSYESEQPHSDELSMVDSVGIQTDSVILVPVTMQDPIYPNLHLDRVARFISGLPQLDSNAYQILEDSKHWLDYQANMNDNWRQMDSTRLEPMVYWKEEYLSPLVDESFPLFYPFSGPDLLHAAIFYPQCQELILSGLEPITEMPDLLSYNSYQQDQFLDSLSSSLKDIFGKSFFITKNMKKDLRQVKGVIPLLMIFTARTGHEVVGYHYISIDSTGLWYPVPFKDLSSKTVRGVRIEFRNRGGGALKTLYYFSGDVSNGGLGNKKNWLRFLNNKGPMNTYIKSASYLMHQNPFSGIRDQILQSSASIFQDDTGVPYRFLKSGDYDGYLFGEYMKPVKDFMYLEKQPDLDSAFRASSYPMPFSLGYHWGSRKQHYMLFIKKNPIFVP